MPYLSSLPLNPLRSGAQRLLSNPQRMHAAVEGVLPPSREGRILWRLERVGAHATLLIQSPEIPSLEHLVEQAGWPSAAGGVPRVASLDPLLTRIARGRQFEFRCRLNPVQNVPVSGGRSIRRGHRTVGHQLEWFSRRADLGTWGFRLLDPGVPTLTIVERQQLAFKHGDSTTTIDTATFEGVLEVTDVERITTHLLGGIGSGKAYGCGLLTLAARH